MGEQAKRRLSSLLGRPRSSCAGLRTARAQGGDKPRFFFPLLSISHSFSRWFRFSQTRSHCCNPKLELSSRSGASSTEPTLQIVAPPLSAPPHGRQSSSSVLALKIAADFQWRSKRAPFCPLFDFSTPVSWPLPSLSEILPPPAIALLRTRERRPACRE